MKHLLHPHCELHHHPSTMSFGAPGILPSAAAKSSQEEAPSEASKREDWRKAKELDEARKAGTAPALVDEEGK